MLYRQRPQRNDIHKQYMQLGIHCERLVIAVAVSTVMCYIDSGRSEMTFINNTCNWVYIVKSCYSCGSVYSHVLYRQRPQRNDIHKQYMQLGIHCERLVIAVAVSTVMCYIDSGRIEMT